MSNDLLWFMLAYTVGTGFGWYLGFSRSVKDSATLVVDKLIEDGYLRTRKDADGNLQILKLDEE